MNQKDFKAINERWDAKIDEHGLSSGWRAYAQYACFPVFVLNYRKRSKLLEEVKKDYFGK